MLLDDCFWLEGVGIVVLCPASLDGLGACGTGFDVGGGREVGWAAKLGW